MALCLVAGCSKERKGRTGGQPNASEPKPGQAKPGQALPAEPSNPSTPRNALADALAGQDDPLVARPFGAGGMGFEGPGSPRSRRIHGLGRVDLGAKTVSTAERDTARKPGGKGQVRIGQGRSTGFCKRADIDRVVRSKAAEYAVCYRNRLMVKKGLKGKLTARWTIGTKGRVKAVAVASNSTGDHALASCVLRQLRRLTFAKPEGGVCIAQWPFVFRPSERRGASK